jgi:hypothetical protein
MTRTRDAIHALAAVLLSAVTGCADRNDASANSGGVKQTRFPGQVTAGGGTSGEVIARTGRATEGEYRGGTPGIAGGAGGTTGGPATGGTVQETGKGPAGTVPPPAGQTAGSR